MPLSATAPRPLSRPALVVGLSLVATLLVAAVAGTAGPWAALAVAGGACGSAVAGVLVLLSVLARYRTTTRSFFDAAGDAVLLLEPETERVLGANTAACALYGYARHEIVGMSARADAGLFDRVVTNLVGNAVKFTERGGVRVTAHHDGERLWVEVTDTGIGIAPDALDRLFEPFEQASDGHARTHEGNGLGLAIVRDVVALMGGAVTVESVVGEGSRFRVRLPAPLAAPSPVIAG